jgi:hypothetical protein
MLDTTRSRAESEFRRSRRWLLILLGLLFPVTLVASKLSNIIGSDLVFGVSEAILMIAFTLVSVWSFVAYCRWTGKYPFYWLRRPK